MLAIGQQWTNGNGGRREIVNLVPAKAPKRVRFVVHAGRRPPNPLGTYVDGVFIYECSVESFKKWATALVGE